MASSSTPPTLRVAVIGAGAGGLAAAYGLRRHARLTLYEASSQLGGHANTVMVGDMPVDTGFLVYNENTYPNLIGLFEVCVQAGAAGARACSRRRTYSLGPACMLSW